jgi:GH15 family glucan-1,4-alpha-glucosidase
MEWTIAPRFGYAADGARLGVRSGVPVCDWERDAIAMLAWDAGEPTISGRDVGGRWEAREGERSLLVVSAAHQEPLVFPARDESEARLDETIAFWKQWSGDLTPAGRWRDAVVRSVLALKLLVFAPTGAISAAPTTSLPEKIGGERNWDYRFCWLRDSAFVLEALLDCGAAPEAESFLWWLLQACQLTRPRVQVLYRLDGRARAPERELPLSGYRASGPVRVGNGAAEQTQLDIYGDLFQTVWIYVERGYRLDGDAGKLLAGMADLVADSWRERDRSLWEVRSEPMHFTHSKMMSWVALDRACQLAEAGAIPADHAPRWRSAAESVSEFVEHECYSSEHGAYMRAAGSDDFDASVLLASIMECEGAHPDRVAGTIDVVRRELGRGPFLQRYTGDDGLEQGEGCFLVCSFWLAEALARTGRLDEASELMDELVAEANDVGLFAEEIEPDTREFLGNFPQALTHLGLVSAATAIAEGKA